MGRSRILFSLDAARDLDSLFGWIAHESGIDRAEAILRRIDETLDLIATIPRIGQVRHDLDGGPRTFAVWPWVIVYEPQSTRPGIVVWRIVDGRRDLPRHVQK